MEDIQDRLKETSETCLKAHETWAANKKDKTTRQALRDAIHESRKVTSRLEIDLAVSERDEMASKPIPVPQHRSHARQAQSPKGDNAGNSSAHKTQRKPRKAADNS